eukprot:149341-Prorocentrum_minimum.AAC.1
MGEINERPVLIHKRAAQCSTVQYGTVPWESYRRPLSGEVHVAAADSHVPRLHLPLAALFVEERPLAEQRVPRLVRVRLRLRDGRRELRNVRLLISRRGRRARRVLAVPDPRLRQLRLFSR